MKRLLPALFFIACIIANSRLHAQANAPEIKWQRAYGGTHDEEFRGMVLTKDNGFIAVGLSQSNDGDVSSNLGNSDFWIVKCDSTGLIEWQKVYGGSLPDWGRNITKNSDGGYMVCGYTKSNDNYVTGNHGDYDFWVLKLDSTGNIIWKKCYGGSAFDNAYCTLETSDGNYLVVGFTESADGQVTGFHGTQDYWILKLDHDGNIIWSKAMGGSGKDQASCAIETADHNYLIAGYTESNDGDITDHKSYKDMWVVKLDPSGVVLWKKCFGGGKDDGARWLTSAADGGYVLGGFSGSSNIDCNQNFGIYDYWVIKVDASGNLKWQKNFGGSDYEYSYYISTDHDGNYLVAGYSFSMDNDITNPHGGSDYWLVKIDTGGNLIWQKSFGGSVLDECRVVLAKSNGNYLLAGFTSSVDDDVTGNHGGEDGWIIEACENPQTFYADNDADGYGNSADSLTACTCPGGYVTNALDCNDANAAVHPSATEVCNGIDDDCSTVADDNISAPIISANGNTSFCAGTNVLLTATNMSNLASYQWYKNSSPVANATATTYSATAGGSYLFKAAFQSCSSTSNTISLTKLSKPTATITPAGNLNICNFGSVTLAANSGAGLTYKWNRNGNKISGATNQTYVATDIGDYTVKVTNANGCDKKSDAVTVYKTCRLSENDLSAKISVYPNPSDGKFEVKVATTEAQTVSTILFDLLGKPLMKKSVVATGSETILTFNVASDLPGGMYFLQVTADDQNRLIAVTIDR